MPYYDTWAADVDQFSLLARQDYNLGNAHDWFGEWRGGYLGACLRLDAAEYHHEALHTRPIVPPTPIGQELHLADLLFSMDSALECTVYMLNALGFAVAPDEFLATDDAAELSRVAPSNLSATANRKPCGKDTVAGYQRVYPRFLAHWRDHEDLVTLLCANHDVSKHRASIFKGGKLNLPEELRKKVKLTDLPKYLGQVLASPMSETVLQTNPKAARAERQAAGTVLLEDKWAEFVDFVGAMPDLLLADVQETISLNEAEFRPSP